MGVAQHNRRFGALHIGFLTIIGLIGWAATIALTLFPPAFLRPWELSWPLVVVGLLGALARLFAVRVFGRVRIAADTALYVASIFVFGVVPAAWLPLLILTFDAAMRQLLDAGRTAPTENPLRHKMASLIYNGALPALALLVSGIVFHVDSLYPLSDAILLWYVPLVSVTLLIVHYSFAGSQHWFFGEKDKYFSSFFVLVLPAESLLIPSALAMVLGYIHQGTGLFLLIGGTTLVFNILFRQAATARKKLRDRVEELSTLDEVGRTIAGTLDQALLLKKISAATLELVGSSSRFMLGLVDDENDGVNYQLFNKNGDRYRELRVNKGDGISGWVMDNRKPLRLGNVGRDYDHYAKNSDYYDSRFNSWLGVPLVIYDEVVGCISVQSEARHAYSSDHLRVLATIADQAAVALENARLYELATVDGLSGLLVRRYFDQRLREEWERAKRYDTEFCLAILDLDDFKVINDTYGHPTGDKALRAAATIIRENMRGVDLAARWGGEEFAFLLPRTPQEEGLVVAERIRTQIAALVIDSDNTQIRFTASFGMVSFPDPLAHSPEALLERADQALYLAKHKGKNRVELALQ
ncbi:GGDEF domain-containing protein [Myxococcota bacterium]|nr:GGDEF domain-containing protein [Myxococcota bacterium]